MLDAKRNSSQQPGDLRIGPRSKAKQTYSVHASVHADHPRRGQRALEAEDRQCREHICSDDSKETIAADPYRSLWLDVLDEQHDDGLGQAQHELEDEIARVNELI